jgi:hypothetical protein
MYTRFLHRQVRKESNVTKAQEYLNAYCPNICTVLLRLNLEPAKEKKMWFQHKVPRLIGMNRLFAHFFAQIFPKNNSRLPQGTVQLLRTY